MPEHPVIQSVSVRFGCGFWPSSIHRVFCVSECFFALGGFFGTLNNDNNLK